MARNLSRKSSQWINKLLPACDNDIQLARRELGWLKEKIVQGRHGDDTHLPLTPQEQERLDRMVEDRTVLHKPLQYILGTQPFCGLEIVTRPPVLIPRWETEEWTNRIIELLRPRLSSSKPPFRILDVCTGTGCIGLALAAHLPKDSVEITGLDISNDAITLAQENLLIHKSMIKNPIEFHQKDIFQYERDSTFNLIVSNPPYISHEEYKNIDPGVKDWEDPRALVTEEDGTRIHKRIIHVAKYCQPVFDDVPRVVMEIGGTHQISRLTKEMEDNELHNTTIWKDLAEKDRVIAAL